jgi:hypothetical protein
VVRVDPYINGAPTWDLRIQRDREWDVTAEVHARIAAGFQNGTVIPQNNYGNPFWDAWGGNLPLRFGVEVIGSEPVTRNNGTTDAMGGDLSNCTPECPWRDGQVWTTDKGDMAPPVTFVGRVDDPATARHESHLWALYPNPCGTYPVGNSEADRDMCDPNAPCLVDCDGQAFPLNQSQLRTTQFSGTISEGGGRWNGTVWIDLVNTCRTVGIDTAVALHPPGSSTPGTNRNLRFRFFDAAGAKLGVYNAAMSDEYATYGLMDNDAIRFAFTQNGGAEIDTIAVDSVDGQRFAVRRVFCDDGYVHSSANEIAQPPCHYPVPGFHRDFDFTLGTWNDPTIHFRSGAFWNPLAMFSHLGDGPEGPHQGWPAEVCDPDLYCDPEACVGGGTCPLLADINGDGVVGGPDFAIMLSEWGESCP